MINDRYREDWVGLSVVWLGAMATGLVEVSLNEVAASIKERIAIFGTKMVDKPTIHTNLGRARALLNAATDTVYAAMIETDTRITQNIFLWKAITFGRLPLECRRYCSVRKL